MENASKAIYMAAGLLIGVMIIGVFTYLFANGSQMGEKYALKQQEEQTRLFNSKFEQYQKKNNNFLDMISVTNLALDNNKKNDYLSSKSVEINIDLGAGKTLFVKKDSKLERNQLFKNGFEIINTHDLLNKNRKDLLKDNNLNFSLALRKETDYFTMVDKNMNYKYLFECTHIKYNDSTARIEKMDFRMVENSEFSEI